MHNVENLYRGNLFTTDYLSSPKGIVKIENNDFTKVIQVAMLSKGFKRGKVCEDLLIGYSYECFLKLLTEKVNSNNFDKIFLIGLNEYSLEQKKYFEKLVKLTPKNVLIISFLNYLDAENLIYLNTCFDYFSLIRIYESITSFGLQTTVFIPNCHRSTISQMIYISEFENTKIYLDKCTPIILKPSLITTLQQAFNISIISSVKNDLEKIL